MSMILKRRQLLASAAGLAATGLIPGLMPARPGPPRPRSTT
ncbi:MAG: hypothetical protein U5L74_00350 [Ideonella sp.]|nr:hypothetical protein [Ideonella sp.]